ncbi:MAG TPA: hypothetical protein DCY74_06445 [Clostridiales bacterium]|jgi:hypothetical protein|nr:hypothetical protein [Clostridiales bacterium]HCG35012.1 hypothetical protein [Clostridiales bacterium]
MKRTGILLLLLVIAFGGVLLAFQFGVNRIDKEMLTDGRVRFIYENKTIDEPLFPPDAKAIRNLLDTKRLYKDTPSCSFHDDISVSFSNGQYIFCIARDTCPVVYDANHQKYIFLTKKEGEELHSILNRYGFVFPCV